MTIETTYILTNPSSSACSCKDPVEPLTLDEVADRCHAPEEVRDKKLFFSNFLEWTYQEVFIFGFLQIEMIYKIIAHMSANDRVLIAEGSCGSPRSVKVYLGECNVDDLYG